jgi:hypothetical protein
MVSMKMSFQFVSALERVVCYRTVKKLFLPKELIASLFESHGIRLSVYCIITSRNARLIWLVSL